MVEAVKEKEEQDIAYQGSTAGRSGCMDVVGRGGS